MGSGLVFAVALVAVVVAVLVLVGRRWRAEADPGRRRVWLAVLVGGVVVAVGGSVAFVLAVRRSEEVATRPAPSYPSLVDQPDPALRGTVSYVWDPTTSEAPGRRVCARVVPAAGGPPTDALCWRAAGGVATATVAWQPDGRLLVTAYRPRTGTERPAPAWAKLVDVGTRATEDVPADRLGEGAVPPAPATNARGDRLVVTRSEGGDIVAVRTADGTRTVLASPDDGTAVRVDSRPVWSPDGTWFLTWDGRRAVVTTVGPPARSRVLATDVSGDGADADIPAFAVTPDTPLSPG